MHAIRMLGQGIRVLVIGALSAAFLWFAIRAFQMVKVMDLYYGTMHAYMETKLTLKHIFFERSSSTTWMYSLKYGTWKHVDTYVFLKNFWHSSHGHRLLTFCDWVQKEALKEVVLASLVVSSGLFVSFKLKGRKSMTRKKERGATLVSEQQLAKLSKSKGGKHPLYIGEVPLEEGAENQHFLITGTTGSGKSNLLNQLLPQIRNRGDRALIVDLTGDFVARYFDETKDKILNPFDVRTVHWTPWADIRQESGYDVLAKALVGESSLSDRFWDEGATDIISESLKKLGAEANPSLQDLTRLFGVAEYADYAKFFEGTSVHSLTDVKGERTTQSLRMNAAKAIKPLNLLDEGIDPFSIQDYLLDETEKGWLFLSALPHQRESLKPLLSTWIETGVSSILQRSPIQGKKRQKNIWVILDELPALGQIPSLKTALSESRKYGGCIVATIQNIWQMKNTYNQMGGMDLLDQFNTRALFRVGDQQTAEYMARMLGTEEIRENQESLSYGANTMRDGVNINNIELSRPLVLPSELMGLNTFEFFLKMGGSIPAARIKNKLFKGKTIAKAFTPKTLVPVALTEKEKT